MIQKFKLQSENTDHQYLAEVLRSLVPESIKDGKIDFDILKEVLGNDNLLDEEEIAEPWGLNWTGKRQARKLAMTPTRATLRPLEGQGINEENTQNIFIEGDNLEVLKTLQKSYFGKIKMIYIDPPYNTGNDFVYKDDFTDNLQNYIERQGKNLHSNKKDAGRFHANWLNFMYPRLKIAKSLLTDDGLIFVSIDDNEVHNLRALMNEVFGEENFIESIIWKKRYGGGAKERYLVSLHEYILCYSKNIDSIDPIYIPLEEESIQRYYTKKDVNFERRGGYRTHPLEATKSMGERKNLVFPIPGPDGVDILPKRQWLWSKERVFEALEKNELEFIKDKDGYWTVHTKQYLKDDNEEIRQGKMFSIIDNVYTQHGTNEIIDLFKNAQIFSFPKPTNLIKKLIPMVLQSNGDDNIILDIFGGSGTTAQAVMELNKEDGGNRKFIIVQIEEETDTKSEAYKAGYQYISEITKERIRRTIVKIKEETKPVKKEGELNFGEPQTQQTLDLGFKVFKLSQSNFKEWQEPASKTIQALELSFEENAQGRLEPNFNKKSIITEIMLQKGFTLNIPIQQLSSSNNELFEVTDHEQENYLLICLDDKINEETAAKLQENYSHHTFICRDEAITDQIKVIFADKGIIETI